MKFTPKKYRDQEALKKAAAGFGEQLAAAEKISDPAGRLEALLELKSSARRHVSDVLGACSDRAENFGVGGLLGMLGGSIGGGLALATLVNPVLGFALLVGGAIGSAAFYVTGQISDKIMGGASREIDGYAGSMNETLTKLRSGIDETLKTKCNEIAASEKFDSIYDRFPEVRDTFIKTFNKAVARKELPPEPPAANPNPAKFAL